jgi:hypothetical protein
MVRREDAAALTALNPGLRVAVIPNGVNPRRSSPATRDSPSGRVIFAGVMALPRTSPSRDRPIDRRRRAPRPRELLDRPGESDRGQGSSQSMSMMAPGTQCQVVIQKQTSGC